MAGAGSNHLKWLAQTLLFAALALAFTGLSPRATSAEALVVVKLRNADGKTADGEVTLRTKDGKTVATCKTTAGTCRMMNVSGGNYMVTVKPKKGVPPKARPVMIPPNGEVSLIVATGS